MLTGLNLDAGWLKGNMHSGALALRLPSFVAGTTPPSPWMGSQNLDSDSSLSQSKLTTARVQLADHTDAVQKSKTDCGWTIIPGLLRWCRLSSIHRSNTKGARHRPVPGTAFGRMYTKWVWIKIKPPGYGPQILVHVSICQGSLWGYPILTHSQTGQTKAVPRHKLRQGTLRKQSHRWHPGPPHRCISESPLKASAVETESCIPPANSGRIDSYRNAAGFSRERKRCHKQHSHPNLDVDSCRFYDRSYPGR